MSAVRRAASSGGASGGTSSRAGLPVEYSAKKTSVTAPQTASRPVRSAAAEVPAADRQADGAQPGDEPGGVGCTQACGGMGESHGEVLRWDDGCTKARLSGR